MKKLTTYQIILILLNLLCIGVVIYYAIPFFTHDMTIPNPDAMLAISRYESAGICLTIGFIPTIIINWLSYVQLEKHHVKLRILCLLPALLCLYVAFSFFN